TTPTTTSIRTPPPTSDAEERIPAPPREGSRPSTRGFAPLHERVRAPRQGTNPLLTGHGSSPQRSGAVGAPRWMQSGVEGAEVRRPASRTVCGRSTYLDGGSPVPRAWRRYFPRQVVTSHGKFALGQRGIPW